MTSMASDTIMLQSDIKWLATQWSVGKSIKWQYIRNEFVDDTPVEFAV